MDAHSTRSSSRVPFVLKLPRQVSAGRVAESVTRSHPVLRGYLLGELNDAVRHQPPVLAADEVVVDEALAERLRRLGYIR